MTSLAHDTSAEARGIRSLHLAGLLYGFLAAQFMTIIMLAASMAPGYDVAGGAISDLGTIEETAGIFNASLLTVGLLMIAGGFLVFRTQRSIISLGISLIAGIGASGAGLFPLDRGDLHGLFALAAFLFFNLQTASDAIWSRGLIRGVGLALAVLGIAYLIVMVIGDSGKPAVFGAIGHGGTERLIVYPPMIWLMTYGGYLMGQPRAHHVR
ncbi:MAG: DUF998 domain-containing protein [Planctomycetales bacterium]|nr:DUF998 domain-containing protein [Planctomycetales bacterium]